MLKDLLIARGLSRAEVEVALLVARGMTNKAIASDLFVTEKTVKFHCTAIYKKLAVKSRGELIVLCLHIAPPQAIPSEAQTETPVDQPLPIGRGA